MRALPDDRRPAKRTVVERDEYPLSLGPDLRGRAEGDGGSIVLSLAGEFDLAAVPEVDAALRRIEDERPARVVVELSRVSVLDSKALQTLIAAKFRARESRRSFAVRYGAGTAERVIAIAGVEGVLDGEG